MSAAVEEQKPAVPVEASTVEPTPAAAPVVVDETVEPKVEEPVKTEEPAVPAVEEKKEVKPVEPILNGALGYKAPGLKNAFRFSKKHFWFTEEPVSTESLAHYLRGEKPDVAHSTAAWSNKTGKGLVYFAKHADQTATPAGVLNLSEATEVTKDGFTAFFVKIAGHKHTFETQTTKERDGWIASFEKAVAEAKELKEEIINSEEYKEVKTTLGKPTALATHTTAKESTPKKSSDVAPKLAEAESSTAAETAGPARTGSSSSSSSDEEKKKKKASKSKSRSVSRGKRASIFGSFLGKKEKAEEKVEEKKEEKKEESDDKKEETPVPATTTTEPIPVVAPVITEDLPKSVAEEPKTEETPAPVVEAAAPAEEKKVEESKPKPTKRGSIFGGFIKGLKSPTTEKKESELVPATPAKEPETTAVVPKVEETPAPAPAVETPVATTEAPKEEAKPSATTPHKEKEHFSFGKFLGAAKEKAKSPVGEKAPEKAPETKVEEPVKKEEPVTPIVPVEPVAEAPKEEKKEEETTPTNKKRGSIFEKYGEKGLGLFRNASKAGKTKKEEKATAPPKVEEAAEPKEEKIEEPIKPVEKKEETPIADAETKAIGDVVPAAVTVGQAPKSTTEVSATA